MGIFLDDHFPKRDKFRLVPYDSVYCWLRIRRKSIHKLRGWFDATQKKTQYVSYVQK